MSGSLAASSWQCSRFERRQAEKIEILECKASFSKRVTFSADRSRLIRSVPDEGDHLETGAIVVQLADDIPQANLALAKGRAESDF